MDSVLTHVQLKWKLRTAGLYDQYEKRMMQGNMKTFIKDVEEWAGALVENVGQSYVTEQGDVEQWNSNNGKQKEILETVKQYTKQLQEHIN